MFQVTNQVNITPSLVEQTTTPISIPKSEENKTNNDAINSILNNIYHLKPSTHDEEEWQV